MHSYVDLRPAHTHSLFKAALMVYVCSAAGEFLDGLDRVTPFLGTHPCCLLSVQGKCIHMYLH